MIGKTTIQGWSKYDKTPEVSKA